MQCSSKLVVAALCAAFSVTGLSAQSLITDLFSSPSGGGSSLIGEIVAVGSQAFFAAQGPWGRELYVTDGTTAGTRITKDLGMFSSGNQAGHSSPLDLTPLGSEVLFTAIVEGLGRELWKSDGTAAGTVLVKDVSVGASFGNPGDLVTMGGLVYFAAYDGTGSGLWVTDGTTAGTTPIFSGSARPEELTVVGNTIYFRLATPIEGTELWKTDGTLAGTTMVVDLVVPGSSSPTKLTPFNGGLLFSASTGTGAEPWFTDGTAAGTVALGDLWAGPAGSAPAQFTDVGSHAVFVANNGSGATDLFTTDGTAAGTSLLAADVGPDQLIAFGGNAYFRADDGVNGLELWRSNGLTATMFVDIAASGGSSPQQFAVIGNELWFSATDVTNGREPWRTDGTVPGTQLVYNVAPSSFSSFPERMVGFGNDVLCSMTDAGVGIELGRMAGDGSVAAVVADIDVAVASSFPSKFVALPGGAYFTATNSAIGNEGYITDGTAAGTTAIDVWALPGVGSTPNEPVAVGNEVFFSAGIGLDRELWKSDGTALGTVQLTDLGNVTTTSPFSLAATANGVVFMGWQPGSGYELFASDGTPGGTSMIYDITPGGASTSITEIASNGTVALFAAYLPATGSELWITDGTAAGTIGTDLNPGPTGSGPALIVDANGTFFFTAGSSLNRQLWMSDGTVAGTGAVPGAPAPGGVFALTPSGSRVFGRGSGPGIGQELFVSDGTAAGTLLIDVNTGPGSASISSLTGAAGGAFFLYGSGGAHGIELWFSDGTQAGTGMVLDIAPGFANGVVEDSLVPILGGTQIAFLANDLSNGLQLWTSDGTAAGTVMATSFNGNGVGVASVGEILSSGADVFFAANDGVVGVEPWTLGTGSPFVLEYGGGCAGSGQPVPKIGSSGGPPSIGNAAFAVDVSNAFPNSLAPLYLGFAPANINVGSGCSALLQFPALSFGTAFTNASGNGSVGVPLPNDPAGIGLSVFFQYAVLSPTGPFLGFLDLTDALHVQIGN